MCNDKQFKLILAFIAIVVVASLGSGSYYWLQPENRASLSDSANEQAIVNDSEPIDAVVPEEEDEYDISAYAEELQRRVKAQEDEYKTVDGKEVELVNEPTPEPIIEYSPRYESKEEAAKNPPPKPTKEELTGNTASKPSNNTGTPSGGNTGNNPGENSGGSNLVPASENPFLQPANASNAQATPLISEHIPGTGDKF